MDKYKTALWGGVRLSITGANPELVLNRCAERGIDFGNAVPIDGFTIEIEVRRRDVRRVDAIAQRCLCQTQRLRERGIPAFGRRLRKRFALVLAPLLLLGGLAWSSLHVWDIVVSGNERVTDGEILLALERAGVKKGSFWPDFVSDLIRSEVMVELPELRWITVNISGSRAYVIVRERVDKPKIFDESAAYHVLAGRPGLITGINTLRGQALVKAGDTVAMGDMLVSGAVTSSFTATRAVHARAEIWARTWYDITAAAPLTELRKTEQLSSRSLFSLHFGDRRINFYDNSGNEGDNYGRISRIYSPDLGGWLTLPLALGRETVSEYGLREVELDPAAVEQRLQEELLQELESGLGVGGEIVTTRFARAEKDGILYVTLIAECSENIAAERPMTQGELWLIEQDAVPRTN